MHYRLYYRMTTTSIDAFLYSSSIREMYHLRIFSFGIDLVTIFKYSAGSSCTLTSNSSIDKEPIDALSETCLISSALFVLLNVSCHFGVNLLCKYALVATHSPRKSNKGIIPYIRDRTQPSCRCPGFKIGEGSLVKPVMQPKTGKTSLDQDYTFS